MIEITEIQKKLVHSATGTEDHIRLYFYKKRISKGETYFECANANVDKLYEAYFEVVSSTCSFLEDKEIYAYMSDLPKSAIGYFDLTDDENILSSNISEFSKHLSCASNFDTAIKYDGYIIEFLKDNQFIRLIFSSKPIRTYKKRFSIVNNYFKQEDKPMFEIKRTPDCIWVNDYCLFLTTAAETIFDFVKRYRLLAQKALEHIEKANILSEEHMAYFKKYAMQGRRTQKFETFKSEKLQAFAELPLDKKQKAISEILSMDGEKISIASEEDAKNFLDFVCCKILDDFTGEKFLVTNTQKFNKSSIQH